MKILQIAYYFPPMGGAGVQRGLKFARFLPLHGVQPVVLACDDPFYVRDESLLGEVPAALEVQRVAHSPWLARLARLAASRQASTAGAGSAVAASTPPGGTSLRSMLRGTSLGSMLRDTALRSIRALQWPDDAAPWARQALRQARHIVRSHAAAGTPIDLVFSSAPPASAHWLGQRIAHEAGLPWVADHRDLWTDNPAYDAPGWRRALDRRTEQRWFNQACGVVTVTPSWRELLALRCPAGTPVAFIPNGYDEDDFAALAAPARDPGVFTLVHTGTFYGPRDPAGLLGGLTRYLDGPRVGHATLRVRLVGNMGARFAEAVAAFSQRHPGVVSSVPYLPHRQALAELVAADALLLVVGGGRGPAVRGWLPGKIFEYLRSGQPVLTLGEPEGDAAELIRQHSRGPVVNGDDSAGIAQAVADLVQGRWSGSGSGSGSAPTPAPAPVPALAAAGGTIASHGQAHSARIFERRELAGQLAAFLRECQARHRAA